MRPLSTDELQQVETRGSPNETNVSKASEEKQTKPERHLEEGQFNASLSKSQPRSVSFNEDTIVKSYDENQATLELPKKAETESLKLKKGEKPIEEMSIDDMIRKAAETEDEPEDSGNNYEVCKYYEKQIIKLLKGSYTGIICLFYLLNYFILNVLHVTIFRFKKVLTCLW